MEYEDTRCSYACALILSDRLHGTFKSGEVVAVGQEGRRPMGIGETLIYPPTPVIGWVMVPQGFAISLPLGHQVSRWKSWAEVQAPFTVQRRPPLWTGLPTRLRIAPDCASMTTNS